MSQKAKQQPETELDHIRDTLTDVVGVVGETRQDVKQVKEHLNRQDKDIADIKETLQLILSRLPTN